MHWNDLQLPYCNCCRKTWNLSVNRELVPSPLNEPLGLHAFPNADAIESSPHLLGSCDNHMLGFQAQPAFSGHGKAACKRIIAVSFAGGRTSAFENHKRHMGAASEHSQPSPPQRFLIGVGAISLWEQAGTWLLHSDLFLRRVSHRS